MKNVRFTKEQMVAILREADRSPVANVARKHKVSEQTIYVWRRRFEKLEPADVKGIYKKARAGQIAEFTGISSPYEVPNNPELTVNTGAAELDDCVQQVLGEMMFREIIE